jgi:hypothetical protein
MKKQTIIETKPKRIQSVYRSCVNFYLDHIQKAIDVNKQLGETLYVKALEDLKDSLTQYAKNKQRTKKGKK